MLKSLIIIIFIYLIYSFNLFAKDISPVEALKDLNDNLLIIDVRNKEEWSETGVIPGAKLIQMLTTTRTIRNGYIEEIINTLGDKKDINAAIICHSGGRSSATVTMLEGKGYTNISNISEGMVGDGKTTGWISRGLPIVKCIKECK